MITSTGLAATLTASPALAGQSELENLIVAYDVAIANYYEVYSKFEVAENKYWHWKKTAKPRLIRFPVWSETQTIDPVNAITSNIVELEKINQ